jgi:hypothetical protein
MSELQQLLILIAIISPANSQVVDTWINGSIFDAHRQFIKELGNRNRLRILRAVFELVLCPRCLSHWTAAGLLGTARLVWDVQASAPAWIIVWIATVGLSRYIYQRTNKEEDSFGAIQPYEPPA